jgi:hypothetical protein
MILSNLGRTHRRMFSITVFFETLDHQELLCHFPVFAGMTFLISKAGFSFDPITVRPCFLIWDTAIISGWSTCARAVPKHQFAWNLSQKVGLVFWQRTASPAIGLFRCGWWVTNKKLHRCCGCWLLLWLSITVNSGTETPRFQSRFKSVSNG